MTPSKIIRALKRRYPGCAVCCGKDKWDFSINNKETCFKVSIVTGGIAVENCFVGQSRENFKSAYHNLLVQLGVKL